MEQMKDESRTTSEKIAETVKAVLNDPASATEQMLAALEEAAHQTPVRRTPEQILKHWAEVNWWTEAHLLLLAPKGREMELWKGGDSEFGQYGEHEEFVPHQKHVTILAGRIAEGYIPIGVVGIDTLHPQRERRIQLGYLPTAEAERLMTVWYFGYTTGQRF
jgi:hypothetical protein